MGEHEILPDAALSPEDLEARKKGLALVERIEHFAQTLTEDRVREIVREMFEQMIESAAARISESVKQMIEAMDESE